MGVMTADVATVADVADVVATNSVYPASDGFSNHVAVICQFLRKL